LEIFPIGDLSHWRSFPLEIFPFGDLSHWRSFPLEIFPFGDLSLWGNRLVSPLENKATKRRQQVLTASCPVTESPLFTPRLSIRRLTSCSKHRKLILTPFYHFDPDITSSNVSYILVFNNID